MELPRPLSHSSMYLFNECPRKYKFKYVDRIPEKPRHFFSFGSSVHAALEFFYGVKSLPAPSLEQLLAAYKEHWISAGYKDPAQEQQYFEDGKQILISFHQKHVRDFALPYFVEYSFNFSVEGVPVTGKVDRIDKLEDGTLSIVDYKTGKALAKGRVQTDGQLTMYQLACEQLLGAKVSRLAFYHLPSLTQQAVERHDDGLVDGLKRRITATAEAIVSEKFDPTPDESKCRWCDYKPICPVFKHQFSSRQQELVLARAEPEPDEDVSALVDRLGELQEKSEELRSELEGAKKGLAELLERKGYSRAFGKRFEVLKSTARRWEFSDKKKVLEILTKAGLYEKVLAPSAPKVEQLMSDPGLDAAVRERLGELASKIETAELKLKPL